MNYKKTFLFFLLPIGFVTVLWAFPRFVAANEAVGLQPKTIEVSDNKLVLNGSAVRTVFGFPVYEVGLYLTKLNQDATSIFQDREMKRIKITMLREVTGKKFESTVRKNIKTNFSTKEQKKYAVELERFLDCFVDRMLAEASTVSIDYVPNKGTQVFVDGTHVDLIPGAEFHHALLRLWIGNPLQASIKEGLLGAIAR